MTEVLVKTHLIIREIEEHYHINWRGKIRDANPKIVNGLPIFVIIGSRGRMELNTIDMGQLEENAKKLTSLKGRSAVSTDTSRIYIKEVDGNEMLIGTVTRERIKHFSPMCDPVGWK